MNESISKVGIELLGQLKSKSMYLHVVDTFQTTCSGYEAPSQPGAHRTEGCIMHVMNADVESYLQRVNLLGWAHIRGYIPPREQFKAATSPWWVFLY